MIEFILQLIQNDSRVLVCCPSNTAVDTILQRLVLTSLDLNHNKKVRPVRLGHPARINANILHYSLDSLIVEDDGTEIVRDIRDDIDKALKTISTSRDAQKKRDLRLELRGLRKEVRQRETKVVHSILRHRNVVLCTNIGASHKLLDDIVFDAVIIDEAAQALEASCWIPIVRSSKVIMFGDHQQLPPTIKSQEAASKGLSLTLFERIMNCDRLYSAARMLNIQYRMNRLIADWASTASYNGKLISDASVADHTVLDLPLHHIQQLDDIGISPMLLIDTSGKCCFWQSLNFYNSIQDVTWRKNPVKANPIVISGRRILFVVIS